MSYGWMVGKFATDIDLTRDLYGFLPSGTTIPVGFDVRPYSSLSDRISYCISNTLESGSTPIETISVNYSGLCPTCDKSLVCLFTLYMFTFIETKINTIGVSYFSDNIVCRSKRDDDPNVSCFVKFGYIWEYHDDVSFELAFNCPADCVYDSTRASFCEFMINGGHSSTYFPGVCLLWDAYVYGDLTDDSDVESDCSDCSSFMNDDECDCEGSECECTEDESEGDEF